MKRLQDIAELLVASWVLSRDADPGPLPTTPGLLDRALQSALLEMGAFPPSWRDRLHFVDTQTGLRCAELLSVIGAAQRAQFTMEPNSSYETTQIKISANAARALLRRNSVSLDDVRKWGEKLHDAVAQATSVMRDFPGSRV